MGLQKYHIPLIYLVVYAMKYSSLTSHFVTVTNYELSENLFVHMLCLVMPCHVRDKGHLFLSVQAVVNYEVLLRI